MKVVVPQNVDFISCSVSESDADDGAVWASAKAYAIGDRVRADHVTYVSLADGNRGNPPAANIAGTDAKWRRVSATNPYRMLDEFVETRTEVQGRLTFSLPFSRASAVAMFGLAGTTARFEIVDDDEGVVHAETVQLVRDITSISLFEYVYTPIEGEDTIIRTGLPMPISGRINVEIESGGASGTAGIGMIVVGRDRRIGATLHGSDVGVTDYSRKITDEFGVTTLVRRSFARTASCQVHLHPGASDGVHSLLAELRATPCVWVGDDRADGHTALTVYGWLEEWRSVYAGPNEQQLSLEIQGLI